MVEGALFSAATCRDRNPVGAEATAVLGVGPQTRWCVEPARCWLGGNRSCLFVFIYIFIDFHSFFGLLFVLSTGHFLWREHFFGFAPTSVVRCFRWSRLRDDTNSAEFNFSDPPELARFGSSQLPSSLRPLHRQAPGTLDRSRLPQGRFGPGRPEQYLRPSGVVLSEVSGGFFVERKEV